MKIAEFAKDVLFQMGNGDAAAAAIVDRHMEHIAKQGAALLARHPGVRQVGLHGGIFLHHAPVRDRFTHLLRKSAGDISIQLPVYPPEIGALIHCFLKRGALDAALLARLDQSYRRVYNQKTCSE
jgi:N-acetylglucosamine kinase-like BadF-type ATPase